MNKFTISKDPIVVTKLTQEQDQAARVRVIVSGSFPDRMNSNLALRQFLADGLRQCLGRSAVLNLQLESLPQAIRLHKPELVLCFGSCPPEVTNFGPLRFACNETGAHLAFWLHDDPYEFDLNFTAVEVADTLFSNDRWASMHYNHPRVFHLPLAASVEIHHREWVDQKEIDVFFCGVAFDNRITLLRDLASTLSRFRTSIYGAGWPSWVPGAVNQRITNQELANRSAQSTATLYMGRNLHFANKRYQLDPSTPGPRFFEAAMTGAVQLVFAETLEVLDYFSLGEGFLLYDDPQSFEQHLIRLLDEPMYGRQISEQGQARARHEHTYAHRAYQLLKICNLSLAPSEAMHKDSSSFRGEFDG